MSRTNTFFYQFTCSYLLLLSTFLLSVHGQYNQEYEIQGSKVFWRPSPSDPLLEVIVPDDGAVILVYNCRWLRAICQNSQAFLDSPRNAGRKWNTGFALDMAGVRRSRPRRNGNCAHFGTTHICPETNQPQVEPGPWPYTALETIDSLADYEIQATRDANGNIAKRSGRSYTCEEWPAASWIQGGTGIDGTTGGKIRCAPQKVQPCRTPQSSVDLKKAWQSEQDWQAGIHGKLRRRLELKSNDWMKNRGLNSVSPDQPVFFEVRLENVEAPYSARILWVRKDQAQWQDGEQLGKQGARSENSFFKFPMENTAELLDWAGSVRLDDPTVKFETISKFVISNASEIVEKPTGIVREAPLGISATFGSSYNASAAAIENEEYPHPKAYWVDQLTPEVPGTDSAVPSWNLTAADVDPSLARSRIQTPRQLISSNVDLLALGELYSHDSFRSGSNATKETSHSVGRHRRAQSSSSQELETGFTLHTPLHKRQGPVQCGSGSPCKDNSCCSADGHCGYKEPQCGAGCTSNCDAKAMCGIDSVDGKTACPLKLCCGYYGWCGTEDAHCYDPEPQYAKTACQPGYGACAKTPSPSCGTDSGTATGRRVGYYQGWNSRERVCDKVRPNQINTKGLTHIFFSFVFFHPTTFQMMPMHEDDILLYKEFTALKRSGLQTWIAVGGWSFNDPGPTHMAFSDMVSTVGNRAAFIRSLIQFMDTYGFQGADLDWEYPVDVKRGGRPADADNLVLLVKEMKTAFGGRYGLSLTLAPDFWYLRGFKPAAMQQYVDFMGFMAYDLHGPWDTDVKALGSQVRPQTDITEIDKGLKPLWFDGVNPAKINLGIAYYGRTYRLSDPSCSKMGCPFIAGEGGGAGSCTQFKGILSNKEIRSIIASEGITPYLNATAMVKYFTYGGNSWVGYDDAETYALKQGYANDRCIGGMMIWSIDFDAETGGGDLDNSALVWVNPEIWKQPSPTVQCVPPCTFVLPPWPSKTTTIDYPRITYITTGSTTTITHPPITVTEWDIETVVVGDKGSTSRNDVGPPFLTTIEPKLRSTSTWVPVVTNIGGSRVTLRPKEPHPPPPPLSLPGPWPPKINVNIGPPGPLVKPCSFPFIGCPPIGSNPGTNGGGGNSNIGPPGLDSPEAEEEDGEEEEASCIFMPRSENEGGGSPGKGAPRPPASAVYPTVTSIAQPRPTPKNHPDPKTNKVSCYNSGQWVSRAAMLKAINQFCEKEVPDRRGGVTSNILFKERDYIWAPLGGPFPATIQGSVEIKNGCEWVYNVNDCKRYMEVIVDSCDCSSTEQKRGGTLESNCLKWKLDPQTRP